MALPRFHTLRRSLGASILAAAAAALAVGKQLSGRVDAERPRLDGLLAIKGVVEVIDAEDPVSLGDQASREVAPNEARDTGNGDLQLDAASAAVR